MSFKEMVEADNKSVFLNASEFADIHTVKYNGITYEDIPILLTKTKEMKRPITMVGEFHDHMEGVHLVTATAHIALKDMDGVIPEQKQMISISDGEALGVPFFQEFRIATSDCENGMIVLELEAYDE